MNITQQQLKQIIKEETQRALNERDPKLPSLEKAGIGQPLRPPAGGVTQSILKAFLNIYRILDKYEISPEDRKTLDQTLKNLGPVSQVPFLKEQLNQIIKEEALNEVDFPDLLDTSIEKAKELLASPTGQKAQDVAKDYAMTTNPLVALPLFRVIKQLDKVAVTEADKQLLRDLYKHITTQRGVEQYQTTLMQRDPRHASQRGTIPWKIKKTQQDVERWRDSKAAEKSR